jgi:RNA polymerase sigma-70 factor (sigma-E family)
MSTAGPQEIHRVIHKNLWITAATIEDTASLIHVVRCHPPTTKGQTHMDPAAEEFESYVRARTPALLRTAYLLTGDQHRSEDLVQDALIRTHRAWSRLRLSNPDAYTRKVMYHLNIARWRRGVWAEVATSEVPEPRRRGPADESSVAATRLALHAALGKLTSKQRAVLVLRFFEDATEAEAAEVLGVTVGTVKSQTAKALARLRAIAPQLIDEHEGVLR